MLHSALFRDGKPLFFSPQSYRVLPNREELSPNAYASKYLSTAAHPTHADVLMTPNNRVMRSGRTSAILRAEATTPN